MRLQIAASALIAILIGAAKRDTGHRLRRTVAAYRHDDVCFEILCAD
jgi:hypothetical protein